MYTTLDILRAKKFRGYRTVKAVFGSQTRIPLQKLLPIVGPTAVVWLLSCSAAVGDHGPVDIEGIARNYFRKRLGSNEESIGRLAAQMVNVFGYYELWDALNDICARV